MKKHTESTLIFSSTTRKRAIQTYLGSISEAFKRCEEITATSFHTISSSVIKQSRLIMTGEGGGFPAKNERILPMSRAWEGTTARSKTLDWAMVGHVPCYFHDNYDLPRMPAEPGKAQWAGGLPREILASLAVKVSDASADFIHGK